MVAPRKRFCEPDMVRPPPPLIPMVLIAVVPAPVTVSVLPEVATPPFSVKVLLPPSVLIVPPPAPSVILVAKL